MISIISETRVLRGTKYRRIFHCSIRLQCRNNRPYNSIKLHLLVRAEKFYEIFSCYVYSVSWNTVQIRVFLSSEIQINIFCNRIFNEESEEDLSSWMLNSIMVRTIEKSRDSCFVQFHLSWFIVFILCRLQIKISLLWKFKIFHTIRNLGAGQTQERTSVRNLLPASVGASTNQVRSLRFTSI